MTNKIRFVVDAPLEEYQQLTRGARQSNVVHRQKRVSRACKTCKQKKIRCSGGQPCAVCTTRGIACEYAEDTEKEMSPKRQKREASVSSTASSVEVKSLPVPAVITWTAPATDPSRKSASSTPPAGALPKLDRADTSEVDSSLIGEKTGVDSQFKIQRDHTKDLKSQISSQSFLRPVDFKRTMYVTVDSSSLGWGAILSQEDDHGWRYACKYKSGLWNPSELEYTASKMACLALMQALKKFRYWLMGSRFVVETNSGVLGWILDQPVEDMPNSVFSRWIKYIKLFDFDVRTISPTAGVDQDIYSSGITTPESMSTSTSTASSTAFDFNDYCLFGFDSDFDFDDYTIPSSAPSLSQGEKLTFDFDVAVSDEHLWDEFEETSWDSSCSDILLSTIN